MWRKESESCVHNGEWSDPHLVSRAVGTSHLAVLSLASGHSHRLVLVPGLSLLTPHSSDPLL